MPTVAGSVWSVSGDTYTLLSCPPGYQLLAEECEKCLPGFYCIGGTCSSAACPDGMFTASGATLAVDIAQAKFTTEKQEKFILALSFACGLLPDQATIQSLAEQRRSDLGSLLVVVKLAAKDAVSAYTIQGNLNQAEVSKQMLKEGFPNVTLESISIALPGSQTPASMVWILTVSFSCVILVILMIALTFFSAFRKRTETKDERALRSKIAEIRKQLMLLPQDGFVLHSEGGGVWFKRQHIIYLRQSHLDAAARLALNQEYDMNQFDAFCLCLEGDDLDSTEDGKEARRYLLLCQWFLGICRELLRPDLTLTRVVEPNPSVGQQSASNRFKFFLKNVAKARILHDDGALFLKLKGIAEEMMKDISHMCDERYKMLRAEQRGQELASSFLEANTVDSPSEIWHGASFRCGRVAIP